MLNSYIDMTKIFTIGFSGKKPEIFLEILDAARIRCVWDIRLWRVSKYVPYYSGDNLASVLGERTTGIFGPYLSVMYRKICRYVPQTLSCRIHCKYDSRRRNYSLVSSNLFLDNKNTVISIRYPFIDMVQKGCRQIWGG